MPEENSQIPIQIPIFRQIFIPDVWFTLIMTSQTNHWSAFVITIFYTSPSAPVDLSSSDATRQWFQRFTSGPEFERLCSYIVGQVELCPDTSRPHFQGYLETKTRQRIPSFFRKLLGVPKRFGFGDIQQRRGNISKD